MLLSIQSLAASKADQPKTLLQISTVQGPVNSLNAECHFGNS